MKKNAGRLSKKLFAAMMAGTMMTAMVGANVYATGVISGEGETSITNVGVKKTVKTDGDTFAPNTIFTFNVDEATPGANEMRDGVKVSRGIEGGLTAGQGVRFSPNTDAETQATYEATGSLSVNDSVFNHAGVYKYTVSEVDGVYEGIAYDDSIYNVYVYVYNKDTEGVYVGNVVTEKVGEEGNTKADLSFENDYGYDEENNDTTHDVKITKNVTGNQGDKAQSFNFTTSINASETGEAFKIVVKETANSNPEVKSYTAGGANATATIKDGGSIQILGLSANDTYTVTEDDYSGEGYTTKIDNVETRVATGTVNQDGTSVIVENNRIVSAATGIAMTYGPYALMVALAGGMAALFLRRRNREDY